MTAPSNAELLDLIDAELISLLAVAYFGPAEQGTASSVDQACAAEILLFRLRAARRAVRDLRDAYGIDLPVRRAALSPVGGLGSNHPLAPGERLVPGSGAAITSAVTESGSAVVAAAAGAPNPPAGSEGGRAGDGAAAVPGAVQDFGLPRPPRFSMREGERRLYGYVDLPAQQVGVAEYRGRP